MDDGGSGDGPLRRVAAFDFDGTVSRRDTLVPFLVRVSGRRRFAAASTRLGLSGARGAAGAGGRARVDLRDRDLVKERLLAALFAGRWERDLRRAGELYARDLLSDQLRPEVLGRIDQHRAAGHEVLFVSASLVYYLEPLADLLDVDAVLAVEPEVVDGRLTGALARPNVRAEQKALRLREWLDQPEEGPLRGVELWAYGNSSGDHALLGLADHAAWLGRPSKVPPGAEPFTRGEPFARSEPFSH